MTHSNGIKKILLHQAQCLEALSKRVDDSFAQAVSLLKNAKGKIVVTGMGKSGLVGKKIVATFNSTGSFAVFLHPAEALHGDLGILGKGDVIIAIGNSGESQELKTLLPAFKNAECPIVAIVGNVKSTLAAEAQIVLDASVEREACPHNLAPTSSTLVAMAIGDALALQLMEEKNFKVQDFASFHPGGQLGKRLLLKVKDIMIPLREAPVLNPDRVAIEDVIGALGRYGLGLVLFSRVPEKLDGILTDGDVRRLLSQHKSAVFQLRVADFINSKAFCIDAQTGAAEALRIMESRERPLNVVPVTSDSKLVGVLRLHELVKLG